MLVINIYNLDPKFMFCKILIIQASDKSNKTSSPLKFELMRAQCSYV